MSENEWPKSSLEKLALKELRETARAALQRLDLEYSSVMARYWICAVTSNFYLEYESSFTKISIPSWFPKRFDYRLARYDKPSSQLPLSRLPGRRKVPVQKKLYKKQSDRVYPPALITKKDSEVYVSPGLGTMILPTDHELCSVVEALRGKRAGRPPDPDYGDRLAVQCAMLSPQMSKIEIADKLCLHVPLSGIENEEDPNKRKALVRRLIKRGKKLIEEYDPGKKV